MCNFEHLMEDSQASYRMENTAMLLHDCVENWDSVDPKCVSELQAREHIQHLADGIFLRGENGIKLHDLLASACESGMSKLELIDCIYDILEEC